MSDIEIVILPKSRKLGPSLRRLGKEIIIFYKELTRCYPMASKYVISIVLILMALFIKLM